MQPFPAVYAPGKKMGPWIFGSTVFHAGCGFKVQGSGFKVQGSRFRVQGSRFRVQGSRFKVQGSGFRVQGSRFRVQGSGFRVAGSGLRVKLRGWRRSGFPRQTTAGSSTGVSGENSLHSLLSYPLIPKSAHRPTVSLSNCPTVFRPLTSDPCHGVAAL